MSLSPPAYIVSLQNNLRARPISWEGAVRAKTITEAELRQIKSVDKVRKEQRKQTIEDNLNSFCDLFLGSKDGPGLFESAAKRQDIIQYLLVLLGDLIEDSQTFAVVLNKHTNPYNPFLAFITKPTNPEDPTPLLTSVVLSKLMSYALNAGLKPSASVLDALPQLFRYNATVAKSSDSGLQDIAAQNFSSVLRTARSRELFWEHRETTVPPLLSILRLAAGTSSESDYIAFNGNAGVRGNGADQTTAGGVGIQLLYHVLLVLWELSFEASLVGTGLDQDYNVIPLYAQLIKVSPKEKVTRLLLSTLQNLLSANAETLLPGAVQVRLPALLNNLKSRHLTDPDLLEDLDSLKRTLEEYSKTQTTFDEYAAELRSGHLRWSPPHRNALFWRENARKIIEEGKSELPRLLAEIMAKDWESDKQVLAIGCNDVACMVKEVPEKKAQLEKFGLKARVMELMQADDETVRWESLRAVGEWLRYSFEG